LEDYCSWWFQLFGGDFEAYLEKITYSWLIFLRWVETTNYKSSFIIYHFVLYDMPMLSFPPPEFFFLPKVIIMVQWKVAHCKGIVFK